MSLKRPLDELEKAYFKTINHKEGNKMSKINELQESWDIVYALAVMYMLNKQDEPNHPRWVKALKIVQKEMEEII
jgi:hypothetical protein